MACEVDVLLRANYLAFTRKRPRLKRAHEQKQVWDDMETILHICTSILHQLKVYLLRSAIMLIKDWHVLVQRLPQLSQVWKTIKGLGSEKEGRKWLETERSIKVSQGGVGKQTEGNKAAQENCGVAFIFSSHLQ